LYIFTLRRRRTAIHVNPRIVSHSRVSEICSNSRSHTSRNLLPGKLRPRTSLICVVAIMMAAADVKPTDTGPEMKSIKKPEKQWISSRLKNNVLC
jgi:hypothetical protein